jgi:hypothetical protein
MGAVEDVVGIIAVAFARDSELLDDGAPFEEDCRAVVSVVVIRGATRTDVEGAGKATGVEALFAWRGEVRVL